MEYLSEDRIAILGAAGAIGSNLAQAVLTLGLTPRVRLYDPFPQGLEGVAEELRHCAFPGARIAATTDIREALEGARIVVSSGGAPRREGMTREDLLRGNAAIAAQLGRDLRTCAPDVQLAIVVFNPADITGLTALVHAGVEPRRVATLAALDSTRLQSELARHFGVSPNRVTGCRTYGGHGESMAVFASTARVDGTPLTDLIGTEALPAAAWAALRERVAQGGKRIIELRGRSSFQSPAHQAALMCRAALGGPPYPWPVGAYVHAPDAGIERILMAVETRLGPDGVKAKLPEGTPEEMAALRASVRHLVRLRDEVIAMGVLPPLDRWTETNPHL